MHRRLVSISVPIVLTAVAVGLSIALLVGWTLVMVTQLGIGGRAWLLVIGVMSLAVIIGVLVVSAVLLVREVLEGRRQTGFIDSVTHELKSPLASLKLCLETLARPELSIEQRLTLHDMMAQDVDRLTVFIDDVLTASQITSSRGHFEMVEVSLALSIERCVHRLCERRRVPVAQVSVKVDGGLGLVTDKTALEIILTNLLDNAIKYSSPGQPVTVTGYRGKSGAIVIEVKDQGIGIAARHLKEVFKRFFRVDREEVHQRHGTGLGLFVAFGLARRLGGRIKAESAGPGMGTVMRVTLPVASRPRAPKAAAKGGEAEAK
ncbi:MAG: HAMP domain-containing histidine kinase [Deltaproteobacteria bacterium]|nr:HAMP domain-containing histidine kinase [Deltaproteobacteria bacterium]